MVHPIISFAIFLCGSLDTLLSQRLLSSEKLRQNVSEDFHLNCTSKYLILACSGSIITFRLNYSGEIDSEFSDVIDIFSFYFCRTFVLFQPIFRLFWWLSFLLTKRDSWNRIMVKLTCWLAKQPFTSKITGISEQVSLFVKSLRVWKPTNIFASRMFCRGKF